LSCINRVPAATHEDPAALSQETGSPGTGALQLGNNILRFIG
jgi:hypothetical protein